MIHQYAALPYRTDAQGKLEILLITSKERRRWVIPKGNPISSMRNYETAAREAFEEAGVEGGIAPESVGTAPTNRATTIPLLPLRRNSFSPRSSNCG